jgi:hypothetical protein
MDQAKRIRTEEREAKAFGGLVAELSLEKKILKDVASGNF